jgi:UDP-N-acetylmuramyl pentapeptide phosphotransferase/UDP-N-acetylglucosamine-1-phosphate transferase
MSAWILALVAPAAVTLALIALLRRSPWAPRLADHPNARSLHVTPTPRLGGIAMMLAALPIAMATSDQLEVAWALALALALVSFADDLRSLPIGVRLSAHFAAAALAVTCIVPSVGLPFVAAILITLAIAWMTNLYNFMDGADGLAGGMAVFGFAAYALAASAAGLEALALGAAVIASAALGFLAFNFPPARVFMGDAGSIPIGFLAGALGLHGAMMGAWPPWFPLLVFSPFVVDATATIAHRLARGERVWIAHRQHYYQRLVLSGWSTRRLALATYAVMVAAAASALAVRTASPAMQYAILAAWSALYIVAIVAIERRGRFESASP